MLWKASNGDVSTEEENWSTMIDLVNERLSMLAHEGRWEAFNIPCGGDYLPETPNVQV